MNNKNTNDPVNVEEQNNRENNPVNVEEQNNRENIIEIKNLKKSYDDGQIKALNGVDLEIKKGEFVSIIGPSGSGKSTLLNMIGALDVADEGSINVSGIDLINRV